MNISDRRDIALKYYTVETVERAAGLQLFNTELKGRSRQLCAVTQCQVVVRRFDDARKQIGGQGRGSNQGGRQ